MEAWKLKMGPFGFYRPVDAGTYNFDGEQDPDPDLDPY
jgi:hypothetical protein